jgi:hypothetical protein
MGCLEGSGVPVLNIGRTVLEGYQFRTARIEGANFNEVTSAFNEGKKNYKQPFLYCGI